MNKLVNALSDMIRDCTRMTDGEIRDYATRKSILVGPPLNRKRCELSAISVERLEKIRVWAPEGLSASQIAQRLSEQEHRTVSRNAVIGLAHRNGIRLIGRSPLTTLEFREAALAARLRKSALTKAERDELRAARQVERERLVKAARTRVRNRQPSPARRSFTPSGQIVWRKDGETTQARKPVMLPEDEILVSPAFLPIAGSEPVELWRLRSCNCHWPVAVEGDTLFCAEPVDGFSPYCAPHHRIGVVAA